MSYDSKDSAATKLYVPSEDEKEILTDVSSKFEKWRNERKTYERQWFISHSMYAGQHYVEWDNVNNRLLTSEDIPSPAHKTRLAINKIFPKVRARMAKFTKQRPIPIVIPASTDREDYLNAKATEKVLNYAWRRCALEKRYHDALHWSMIAGKGFWWFYWDDTTLARVQPTDLESGAKLPPQDGKVGDVRVEVGSPFELLVSDINRPRLEDQTEIMRVKIRTLGEARDRFPKHADFLSADTDYQEVFHYENRISTTVPNNQGVMNASGTSEMRGSEKVLVKELFTRPCGKYPKGRYVAVAGNVVVKMRDELPHGFDIYENPFPCVEFRDTHSVGRFWPVTVLEQLIDLQKEYNKIRSNLATQLNVMIFPKMLVAKQHQIAEGAYTSEAGELLEYVAIPNMPPPMPLMPANIASDAWKALELIKEEFDSIMQIYPASEGAVGGAASGFQTNLLQEATDSVHAPDIRSHELTIEEAALKMRRVMKRGYDIPRLITITGKNMQPDVFEFSKENIDENADIIVQVGSALPQLKAAKIQSVLEIYDRQGFGPIGSPEANKQLLKSLEMEGLEGTFDMDMRDETLARFECMQTSAGAPIEPPRFWHNHDTHYRVHADDLKSMEVLQMPEEQRLPKIIHLLQHMAFTNPQDAVQHAQEYGPQVLEAIKPMLPPAPSMPTMPGPGAIPGAHPQMPGMQGMPPPSGAPPQLPQLPGRM